VTPDEETARKSYERDRKREQRRRKNESQADCITMQNKRPQSEEEPLTRGNKDTSSLLRQQPSFAVSTQWIMFRPELKDRGICHLHADYIRLPRLISDFRVVAILFNQLLNSDTTLQ
jgi:hypothetical protein